MNKITSKVYDKHVIQQGIQPQIDAYYEPKQISMRRRIKIVMKAIDPKPEEKILDIGCGVGTFAFHCAKVKTISFGIDYSEESIRVALRLSKRYGVVQNSKFIVGDAVKLPFGDSYFDKVVAADFIEHITFKEKEELLKEICRVLNLGGKIIIFTPNGIREKIGEIYWRAKHRLFGSKIPKTDLHFGLTDKASFEKLCKRNRLNFKPFYRDVIHPYLAWIPFIRRFLALNLLWIIRREDVKDIRGEVKKILVINLGGIGDILLSTPALRALRIFYPDSKIYCLVVPRVFEFVKSLSYIDEVFILEPNFRPNKVFTNLKTILELRKIKIDLAINLRTIVSKKGAAKIRFLLAMINPKVKAGRDTDGRGYFFDIKISEPSIGQKYELSYDIDMLAALGIKVMDTSINLVINQQSMTAVSKALEEKGISSQDVVIGIHPGGKSSRRWPMENFATAIKELTQKLDCWFLITGSKEESYLADKLIKITGGKIINMAGKLDLQGLAALIKRCNLYISNDTGPVHIAAVLKTPLLAIFGGGDVIRFDPRHISDKAAVLYKKHICAPCNKMTCRSMECLKDILPQEAVEAALDLLKVATSNA